jgi:hypothetical protein
MHQIATKKIWDKTICVGLLSLALLGGFAAGMWVAIILRGL